METGHVIFLYFNDRQPLWRSDQHSLLHVCWSWVRILRRRDSCHWLGLTLSSQPKMGAMKCSWEYRWLAWKWPYYPSSADWYINYGVNVTYSICIMAPKGIIKLNFSRHQCSLWVLGLVCLATIIFAGQFSQSLWAVLNHSLITYYDHALSSSSSEDTMFPDTGRTVGPCPTLDMVTGGENTQTGWKWKITLLEWSRKVIEGKMWQGQCESSVTEIKWRLWHAGNTFQLNPPESPGIVNPSRVKQRSEQAIRPISCSGERQSHCVLRVAGVCSTKANIFKAIQWMALGGQQ